MAWKRVDRRHVLPGAVYLSDMTEPSWGSPKGAHIFVKLEAGRWWYRHRENNMLQCYRLARPYVLPYVWVWEMDNAEAH